MKYLTLATLLLSLNLFAKGGDPDCAGNCNNGGENLQIASIATRLNNGVIETLKIRHMAICNNFKTAEVDRVLEFINKEFKKPLDEHLYKRIECFGGDLLNMYVRNPLDLQVSAQMLEFYFLYTEDEKEIPVRRARFNNILLNEVQGKNVIRRINDMLGLKGLSKDEISELENTKKRYCTYLNNSVPSCKKSQSKT